MLAITPMTDPKHNKIAKCLWLYKKKTIRILTKTSLKLKPQKGSMFD
jgi:hypothetical protein